MSISSSIDGREADSIFNSSIFTPKLTTLNTDVELNFQTGTATDIGGGRENQDESFIWNNKENNILVLGVFDGHGREVGRIAAVAAKESLLELLQNECDKLIENPVEFLVKAHEIAHTYIRDTFKTELERQGYEVQLTDQGYLLKRKKSLDNWSCVHGGTSCSLIAVIGTSLYTANVGDSSALLCSAHPVLEKSQIHSEVDAAVNMYEIPPGVSCSNGQLCNTMVLTAEHSPENYYEYARLRKYRHRDGDPSIPALHVVYDTPSVDKSQCSPVFESHSDYQIPSQRGSYYKNVRKEWASLVSTPVTASFQDALAFTRSLGDLHLHTYGVTHLPEVSSVDLMSIFDALYRARCSVERSLSEAEELSYSTVCIVIATDGVWDNWLFEDVGKFMFDQSCLNATKVGIDGAQKVASSFMIRNAQFSRKNFGSQADNATGIVLYIRC